MSIADQQAPQGGWIALTRVGGWVGSSHKGGWVYTYVGLHKGGWVINTVGNTSRIILAAGNKSNWRMKGP